MLYDPKWNEAKTRPVVDKVGEVLFLAADMLERDGWCQGMLCDVLGRRCLMQAINDASYLLGGENRASISFAALDRFRVYQNIDAPASWNDERDRTKAQVIDALCHAAVP